MKEIHDSTCYEIVGLPVRVVSSKDPTIDGARGVILLETMNTIKIREKSKVRTIPKSTCTFEVIKDGAALTLDGAGLLGRPEDRITKAN